MGSPLCPGHHDWRGAAPPAFHQRLPTAPPGDEAWTGLEAQRIIEQAGIGIWSPTAWGQPAGPYYWTAFIFLFAEDTTALLRTSTALLGIATIPVFYLFVRQWYGVRAAVLAAVLLAFSYWHIHYSRTAFGLISAPLVECAVLLFLGKGLKDKQTWPFLAAGALAGLGMYSYRGYVYFPFLLVALWGIILVFRPYPLKLLVRHAALFAIPALLIAIPMFKFVAQNYADYVGYNEVISTFRTPEYEKAVEQGGQVSYISGELARASSRYYFGRHPDATDGLGANRLLDPVTMVLFSLGLVVGILRFRRWEYFLIPAGVAIGLAAVATTVDWGENRRGIGALPMVFAAAGVGGDVLLSLTQRRFRLLRARWAVVLRMDIAYLAVTGLLIFAAAWNILTYFPDISRSPASRFAFAYELSLVSEYLRTRDPEPYVYFYSPRWGWNYEARRFQAPGLKGEDRSHEFGHFSLARGAGHQRVLYLLMPPYDQQLPYIQEKYPGGESVVERDGDRILYVGYYLDGS